MIQDIEATREKISAFLENKKKYDLEECFIISTFLQKHYLEQLENQTLEDDPDIDEDEDLTEEEDDAEDTEKEPPEDVEEEDEYDEEDEEKQKVKKKIGIKKPKIKIKK